MNKSLKWNLNWIEVLNSILPTQSNICSLMSYATYFKVSFSDSSYISCHLTVLMLVLFLTRLTSPVISLCWCLFLIRIILMKNDILYRAIANSNVLFWLVPRSDHWEAPQPQKHSQPAYQTSDTPPGNSIYLSWGEYVRTFALEI